MNLKAVALEADSIIPTFSRALPKNLVEIAQMIANLDGKVSSKTLIRLLPFVEDPDNEIESLKQEKEENAELQRKVFTVNENMPPDEMEEVDEDE